MENSPFVKLGKTLSLSEKIEQQIIDAIKQKIFLPGDKLLGEMELAQSFGVSRTAVREALHRLAGRGIVEIRKGYGVYVVEDQYSTMADSFYHLLEMKCGSSSLKQIADVRLIIEPEIARLAATNRTDQELDELKKYYAKMEQSIKDASRMIEFDISFHRHLARATQNPILPVIMEPLFQMLGKFISDTYEYPHSPELALKSHKIIVGFVEGKDGNGASKAMRQHMEEAREHAKVVSLIAKTKN